VSKEVRGIYRRRPFDGSALRLDVSAREVEAYALDEFGIFEERVAAENELDAEA
jgi:hypothetical protein